MNYPGSTAVASTDVALVEQIRLARATLAALKKEEQKVRAVAELRLGTLRELVAIGQITVAALVQLFEESGGEEI